MGMDPKSMRIPQRHMKNYYVLTLKRKKPTKDYFLYIPVLLIHATILQSFMILGSIYYSFYANPFMSMHYNAVV